MNNDRIMSEAAEWHARQSADDMDWPAFEAWLGADASHRDAFDDIALLDADIDRHRTTLARLLPVADEKPVAPMRTGWRRGLLGGGIVATAAAVALVVVIQNRWPADLPKTPATIYRAGTTLRDIRIADAQVTLAPGSSISAEDAGRSRVTLNGRAIFSVVHDPSRTWVVRAGGYEIRDVGTRFEVVTGGEVMQVSVAEGAVDVRTVTGTGATVRVVAGRAATGLADGRILTAPAARRALDGWRDGPLVYNAMPLGLVAADVGRASGRLVVADTDVASRPFSGVLAPAQGDAMGQTLAMLADVEARRQGDTIHLGNRVRP